MVRVNVDNVSEGNLKFYKSIDGKTQAGLIDKNAEAFSHKNMKFIDTDIYTNPLISAVHVAFSQHIPLEFSPDLIFNVILQGISEHVAKAPETYRSTFVNHTGKKELITRNDFLVKGSWDNNWEVSILDLGNQISDNMVMDYVKKLINSKFSTTTIAESTAHIAVFMDIVKHYFDYRCITMCGIPWIEITGNKEDWVQLKKSINPLLIALKLQNWNNDLQMILDKFIDVFDGSPDSTFFSKIYNYYGPKGSGSHPEITGWITKLFLFIGNGKINPSINNDYVKIDPSEFPRSLTKTNFKWDYLKTRISMNLIAGNIGVTLTASGALKPEIGWLIAEDKPNNKDKDELNLPKHSKGSINIKDIWGNVNNNKLT
jgi:hypothetical protein